MAEKRSGIAWLTHNYTNLWVEGLRLFLGNTKHTVPSWLAKLLGWPDSAVTEGKDLAYIVGHIIIYLHVPGIIGGLAIAGFMIF